MYQLCSLLNATMYHDNIVYNVIIVFQNCGNYFLIALYHVCGNYFLIALYHVWCEVYKIL